MGLNQKLEALFVLPLDLMNTLPSLRKAIEKNDEVLFDLNRDQLDRGLDDQDKSLGQYKNYNYKKRWAPVDLKRYNNFRGKLTLVTTDTETQMFSQDGKAAVLEKRWGKGIIGVAKQYYPNIADGIREDFIADVRRKLFKK